MKPAAEFEQIDGRFEGIDELLVVCRAIPRVALALRAEPTLRDPVPGVRPLQSGTSDMNI